MLGFVYLAFSVTGLVHVIAACTITVKRTRVCEHIEQAAGLETQGKKISLGAWLPVHFVPFRFTIPVQGFKLAHHWT